jgi:hypothetical protein
MSTAVLERGVEGAALDSGPGCGTDSQPEIQEMAALLGSLGRRGSPLPAGGLGGGCPTMVKAVEGAGALAASPIMVSVRLAS